MISNIINKITETGVISIIRKIDDTKIYEVLDALYSGGIRAVEVTFDTPNAAKLIEMIKNKYDHKMIIGAGTVLDTETARIAILSGADFILSPSLNVKVIEICSSYGKLAVPGVLTPTEIVAALGAGAQIVKVFPARTFGPMYLKDVKGPLSQVEIMAVGGINLDNASEFISCGALCLGIGSELVNFKLVNEGKFNVITENARGFIDKVMTARS